MTDRLGVRPDDLRAHAARVDAAGARVHTARRAGAAARAGRGAYGQLCVMVPVMLDVLQDRLVDAIGAAADGLDDTAARLRSAAGSYEDTDGRRAQVLARIKGNL